MHGYIQFHNPIEERQDQVRYPDRKEDGNQRDQEGLEKELEYQLRLPSPKDFTDAHFPGPDNRLGGRKVDVVEASYQQKKKSNQTERCNKRSAECPACIGAKPFIEVHFIQWLQYIGNTRVCLRGISFGKSLEVVIKCPSGKPWLQHYESIYVGINACPVR